MAGALPEPVLLSTFLGMDEITIAGKTIGFKHVFFSWCCMAALVGTSLILRSRLTAGAPGTLQNIFEALIDNI